MLIFAAIVIGLFLYILIGCITAYVGDILMSDGVRNDRELFIGLWPLFVVAGTVYFTVYGMYTAAEWCVRYARNITLKYFSRRKRDGGRHPHS
jgi:hypothetical protein